MVKIAQNKPKDIAEISVAEGSFLDHCVDALRIIVTNLNTSLLSRICKNNALTKTERDSFSPDPVVFPALLI